jgi:O-antigen ligase
MVAINRGRFQLHFDWQILPFALSAIIGWWISYNTLAASVGLILLILGLVLYLLLVNIPDPVSIGGKARSVLSSLLAILPSVIAIYFLLTNDWSHSLGKLAVLDPILRILAAWPLSSIGLGVNPNVIGGVIAAGIPLQVFALRHSRRWKQAILLGLSGIGLLLCQTRGAWLALILALGMWLAWRWLTVRITQVRRARIIWLALVIGVGAVSLGVLTVTPLGLRLLGLGGDRVNIWRNSLDLLGDYPLTGFGLAAYEMTYSTYVLLTHVGNTMHAHNLWLNIWLNQGLLGVVSFAGLVLNAIWPKPASRWRMPALLSLAVILTHSLADDSFYGYGAAALPFLFIPIALLDRSTEPVANEVQLPHSKFQPALVLWGMALAGLVIGLVMPGGRAAAQANIGAVLQTRAELSVYHWPETPIQDALRQSDGVDLVSAVQQYQEALALDPADVTANRRLGQIELARGEYVTACQHLGAAYAGARQQRASAQLLGECYAFADQPMEAKALWSTISLLQDQLNIRRWWYESYLHDGDHATKLKEAVESFLGQ